LREAGENAFPNTYFTGLDSDVSRVSAKLVASILLFAGVHICLTAADTNKGMISRLVEWRGQLRAD
jgi:hypothetical protein